MLDLAIRISAAAKGLTDPLVSAERSNGGIKCTMAGKGAADIAAHDIEVICFHPLHPSPPRPPCKLIPRYCKSL